MIRMGIIGAGGMAARHAQSLRNIEGVRFTAAVMLNCK